MRRLLLPTLSGVLYFLSWIGFGIWPLALAATEFLFPLLFQSYTGVALMPILPMVQIADLGGPLLLSALQAVVNGAFFDAYLAWREGRPTPVWALSASLIALAASGAYGFWRIVRVEEAQKTAPHLRMGMAQPNVGEVDLHTNPYLSVRTLWA